MLIPVFVYVALVPIKAFRFRKGFHFCIFISYTFHRLSQDPHTRKRDCFAFGNDREPRLLHFVRDENLPPHPPLSPMGRGIVTNWSQNEELRK